jgi:hypothetical protein
LSPPTSSVGAHFFARRALKVEGGQERQMGEGKIAMRKRKGE